MAASAAILLLVPTFAAAEVCDKGELFDADIFGLQRALDPGLAKDAALFVAGPSGLISVVLLMFMAVARTRLAALLSLIYFSVLAIISIVGYLTFDIADRYFQAAVAEGCVSTTSLVPITTGLLALLSGLLFLSKRRRRGRTAGMDNT